MTKNRAGARRQRQSDQLAHHLGDSCWPPVPACDPSRCSVFTTTRAPRETNRDIPPSGLHGGAGNWRRGRGHGQPPRSGDPAAPAGSIAAWPRPRSGKAVPPSRAFLPKMLQSDPVATICAPWMRNRRRSILPPVRWERWGSRATIADGTVCFHDNATGRQRSGHRYGRGSCLSDSIRLEAPIEPPPTFRLSRRLTRRCPPGPREVASGHLRGRRERRQNRRWPGSYSWPPPPPPQFWMVWLM